MLLYYLGDCELTSRFAIMSIFYCEWQPPDLRFDSLIVKLLDQLWHCIVGKVIGTRLPIAVVVVPAIIESCPMNSQFFQHGDGFEHFLGSDIVSVSPTAPTYGIVFIVACRLTQAFTF